MSGKNDAVKKWFGALSLPDAELTMQIMENVPEAGSHLDRIGFIVDELRKLGKTFDFEPSRVKDNKKARKYRKKAKKNLKKENEEAAAFELYSKSIAYALPGSRELASAYADRSRMLLEAHSYEECLGDTIRALKAQCKKKLKLILEERMKLCRAVLQASQESALVKGRRELAKMIMKRKMQSDGSRQEEPESQRLKAQVNDDSSEIRGATGIGIRYSDRFGKYIAATRDIRPGEIIASINAYAAIVLPDESYRKCAHCIKGILVSIPCDHCVDVIYCSHICRNTAWKAYHELECPIMGRLKELGVSTIFRLYIHLIIKALREAGSIDNLRAMIDENELAEMDQGCGVNNNHIFDYASYTSTLAATHTDGIFTPYTRYYGSLVSIVAVYYLATNTKIFGEHLERNWEIFETHESLKFLASLMVKSVETVKAHSNWDDQNQLTLLQILPLTALCKRSCNPNIHVIVHGARSVMITILPIKNEEPISIEFGGLHYARISKPLRERHLMNLFTTCACTACEEDWPTFEGLPLAQVLDSISEDVKEAIDYLQIALASRFKEPTVDWLAQKEDICQLIEFYHDYAHPNLNATWLTNLTVPPLDSNLISRLFSRTLFLNDEEKIKFIAKEFHLRRVQMNYIQPEKKNDELARKFRIEGNNILFNHSTRIAILCNPPATEIYTKSIAYATPQSLEQSLAYGDRSAVSMMYQRYPHCLLDIDRALHIGYPDELLAVLYSRRLRCLATMERPQEDIDVALKKTRDALMWMEPGSKERKQIQELLDSGIYHINPLVNYEPPAAPCRCIIPEIEGPFQEIRDAEAIGFRYSPDSGRYLVATRDIQPGEIIAKTDVYVKMLAMQERCYLVCAICGEKTSIGVPCEECVNTVYCSDYCQDIAWHEYHEFECQLLNILTKLGVPVGYRIAIRTTLKAISIAGGVDELKARIDDIDRAENGEIRGFVDNKFDCSTYAAVYIAAGCKEIHPATILMGCIVSIFAIFYLATSTTVLGQTFPPSLEIFQTDHLLSFLARLIVKNLAYNIIDLPEEIDVRSSRPEFVDVSAYDLLLKHNCFPNVHVLKRNTVTTVIARHPISEGQILTDDLYGIDFMMADKATRQAMHRAFFNNEECNCRACVENWPSREGIRNAADVPEIPDTARKLINAIEANRVGLNDFNPYIELQKIIRLVELYYQHALPCGELYQREQEIRYIYHQYMV